MNNQKKLIILVITLSLILIISSSYALLRSTEVSGNNYSISIGNLEVTFKDNQTEKLNLSDMYPMSDEEGESQEKTLTFTVENTGTVGTYYDVYIEELSTNPEFKNVIKYISKKDEEEYKEPKTLSENKYIEITGYLESQQTSTYKVKVWLMEEADSTYMGKEFKAKIVVKAYQESSYAKDIIKSKLVKYEESSKEGFTGGLVAVNTNGELYNEIENNQTIREYRYSGPSVNNYVTFNNETWRVLGVFKDENGEEHVKIVRNEVLKRDVFPLTYIANGISFNIRYDDTSHNYAYWNNYESKCSNNWGQAGLMYWLNSLGTTPGYLKILSSISQKMIAETKYYLGTVTYSTNENDCRGISDTPVQAYEHERDVKKCNNIIKSNITTEGCRVWSENASTWIGKIGLMYPSDYGFSVSSENNNWNTKMWYGEFNVVTSSSWLQKIANPSSIEWFLSPSSHSICSITRWDTFEQNVGYGFTVFSNGYSGVRPTLYLKSDVKIVGGDGSINNQYKLSNV